MASKPANSAAVPPAVFSAEVIEKFLKTARENSKEALQAMINEHGAALVHMTDKQGKSGIMHAAETGHMGTIEILMKYGADIDQRDNNGNTALMKAAKRGFKSMVERLMNHGAKIDAVNSDGRTPLMMAAWHDVPEKTEPILPKRKLETMQFLLDLGVSIERTDRWNETVEKQLRRGRFENGLELVLAEKQKRAEIKADYDRRMNEALDEMKNGIPHDIAAPERAMFKKRSRSDFNHNARYSGLTGTRKDVVISGYVRRPSQRHRPSYH